MKVCLEGLSGASADASSPLVHDLHDRTSGWRLASGHSPHQARPCTGGLYHAASVLLVAGLSMQLLLVTTSWAAWHRRGAHHWLRRSLHLPHRGLPLLRLAHLST